MDDINTKAHCVAIWLGDVDREVGSGFSSRQYRKALAEEVWYPELQKPLLHLLSETGIWSALWLRLSKRLSILEQALISSNPTWSFRAWVQQDYCLSKRHSFYFGAHRMSSGAITLRTSVWFTSRPSTENAVCRYPEVNGLGKALFGTTAMNKNAADRECGSPLIDAALRLGDIETTDPRDKVYTLLNLITPEEKASTPTRSFVHRSSPELHMRPCTVLIDFQFRRV